MIIPLALGPRCLLVKVIMVVGGVASVLVLMAVPVGVGLGIGVVVGVRVRIKVGSSVGIFLCPLLLGTHDVSYRQRRGTTLATIEFTPNRRPVNRERYETAAVETGRPVDTRPAQAHNRGDGFRACKRFPP